MAREQDQLLASRQEGWKGFSRFLFWGSIHVAIITLIATLFYIYGASIGLAIFSVLLFLLGAFITAFAVLRS
ncbi:MAG TPA: hypothetical protein VJ790_03680 [Dongiaceae bacterium]|jgi:hypothetical protein|nr:hypothetical protein [Dongiaceae bacterium]